jgi:hypothetical protein
LLGWLCEVPPVVRPEDFDRSVALPRGLTVSAVRKAVEYIERELADLIDLYYEQANVFSAVVGIYGTKALDAYSSYEKSRHLDDAQQRFPDLKRHGSGPRPAPEDCLESKASTRPWTLQAHYNHAGWYIVWRYLVDVGEMLEPGKPVLVWRVDVAFLTEDDWKYERSTAMNGQGGRTHTFGLREAAKRLRGKAVYTRSDIQLVGGKPVPRNGT